MWTGRLREHSPDPREEGVRTGNVDRETAGSTDLIPGRRASGQGAWTGRLREHSPDPREEGVRAQSLRGFRAWEDTEPRWTKSPGHRVV